MGWDTKMRSTTLYVLLNCLMLKRAVGEKAVGLLATAKFAEKHDMTGGKAVLQETEVNTQTI